MKFHYIFEDYIIKEWKQHYLNYDACVESLEQFLELKKKKLQTQRIKASRKSDNATFLILDIDELKHHINNEWITNLNFSITKAEAFFSNRKNSIQKFFDNYLTTFNHDASLDNVSSADFSIQEISHKFANKTIIQELFKETLMLESFGLINVMTLKEIEKKYVEVNEGRFVKPINQFSFSQNPGCHELKESLRKFYRQIIPPPNNKLQLVPQVNVKDIALISFLFGIIVSAIFAIILGIFFIENKESDTTQFFSSFVIYRFIFSALLVFWVVVFAKEVLDVKQINYFYVLNIRPQNTTNSHKNVKGLAIFTVFFLSFVMLDLTYDFTTLANIDFDFPTMIIFLFFWTVLFMPADIWFRRIRYSFVIIIFQIFTCLAPWSPVQFVHVIVADSLCSFTRSLVDLTNSFCWFDQGKWGQQNVPFHYDFCNLGSLAVLIQILPYFLRFLQCLKRYWLTKQAWPNLFNATKYLLSISALAVGGFIQNSNNLVYIWLGLAIPSFLYNNFWDVYMDWGLGRIWTNEKGNIFLRQKLRFSPRTYYLIMILNFIFRLSWITTIIPQQEVQNLFDDPNFFFILTGSVEIFRRFLWSLIRIENEILSNPENLREISQVPKVFFFDSAQ